MRGRTGSLDEVMANVLHELFDGGAPVVSGDVGV